MGSAVQQIASGVSNVANDVTKNPGSYIGASAVGPGGGIPGMLAGAGVGSMIQDVFKGADGPQAPGIDPNLQRLKQKQLQQAQEFRAGSGDMKRKLGENLKTDSNQAMSQAMKQTNESNSARGLLYSGINEGQKQGVRGKAQAGLASGLSGINTDIDAAADQMDAQAINTELGIQQSQQQIQNSVYSQAMARMNAQNGVIGGALGGIGSGLLMASKGA